MYEKCVCSGVAVDNHLRSPASLFHTTQAHLHVAQQNSNTTIVTFIKLTLVSFYRISKCHGKQYKGKNRKSVGTFWALSKVDTP